MAKDKILKAQISAQGMQISAVSDGGYDDYISLTDIARYKSEEPASLMPIETSLIPTAFEKLSDILTERWTINDLIEKDKLVNELKILKRPYFRNGG